MSNDPEKTIKDVLATLVYYDCMDFPLTAFEVWKYLMHADYCTIKDAKFGRLTLRDVMGALESDKLKGIINQNNGFYFLKGREELLEKRNKNTKISRIKFKRLQKVVGWLRFVPFVRMIGITGTLAMKNAEAKSDWDLLIVLQKGHIWTGRTLVTLVVHLLGRRRHGKKITNRVCLNYFITDESLEISTKDLFSAHEYFFFFPLFDTGVYESFQLRNLWIKKIKINYAPAGVSPVRMLRDNMAAQKSRQFFAWLLGSASLENQLAHWEAKRILQNPKTHQEGGMVHFSPEALIFLPEPHGPKVFEKFKKRLRQLNM